jgi:hypothetical protein
VNTTSGVYASGNSRPVRIGIVGMGFGAAVHLPAFAALREAQITALADGGSGSADEVRRNHVPTANVYGNPFDLISDPDIDAVSIATPPAAQSALIAAALDAGKHVICEKPVGANLSECAALALKARRIGVIAAVGFQFRFERGLEAVIDVARQGRCGRIERIAVSWFGGRGRSHPLPFSWRCQNDKGGGVLREYGSHCFDYLACICGKSPKVEWARLGVRIPTRGTPPKPVSAADECDIVCRLPDGGVATIAISNVYAVPTGHRIEVNGSEGCMVFEHRPPFDRNSPIAVFSDTAGKVTALNDPTVGTGTDDSRIVAWKALAKRFIAAAANGKNSATDLPSLDDAVSAWRMIDAVERLCPIIPGRSDKEC